MNILDAPRDLIQDGSSSVYAVPYSPLEHIAQSIWFEQYSRKGLFGMFTCYFDDSGGADHGFTAVCGWVSSLENWRQFAEQWAALLAMFQLDHFTMKECAQWKDPRSPLHDWTESQRKSFLQSACKIINANVRYGFAHIVQHAEYRKVNKLYTLKEYTKSEYALAGITCVKNACDWAAQNYPGEQIEFVFHEGTKGHGGLSDLMKEEVGCIPIFRSDRNQGRMRGLTQLQAADFLAYEVRKIRRDDPNEEWDIDQYRMTVRMLISVPNDWGQYTEQDLIDLCEKHPRITKRAGVMIDA